MSGLADLLASRASLVLAGLTVTWIAIVLLGLVAANLHFRLAHLESKSTSAEQSRTPFGHLLGEPLAELVGPRAAKAARLALVLSSQCESCERILDELRSEAPDLPVALLWRDGEMPDADTLPPAAIPVGDGPDVSRRLGVRVTPFALVADGEGRVVRAKPVGSLATWAELMQEATATPAASSGVTSPISPNPARPIPEPVSQPTLKGVSS